MQFERNGCAWRSLSLAGLGIDHANEPRLDPTEVENKHVAGSKGEPRHDLVRGFRVFGMQLVAFHSVDQGKRVLPFTGREYVIEPSAEEELHQNTGGKVEGGVGPEEVPSTQQRRRRGGGSVQLRRR